MKDKVAPVLKATIPDDNTRGVKDIRAFLRSCNFYRRHIPTFTYSSHLLTDLTKKTVPWKWTREHEAQFQEIKEKLNCLRLLGTPAPDPNPNLEFVASLMRLWWEAVVLFCRGNKYQKQLQKNSG